MPAPREPDPPVDPPVAASPPATAKPQHTHYRILHGGVSGRGTDGKPKTHYRHAIVPAAALDDIPRLLEVGAIAPHDPDSADRTVASP